MNNISCIIDQPLKFEASISVEIPSDFDDNKLKLLLKKFKAIDVRFEIVPHIKSSSGFMRAPGMWNCGLIRWSDPGKDGRLYLSINNESQFHFVEDLLKLDDLKYSGSCSMEEKYAY